MWDPQAYRDTDYGLEAIDSFEPEDFNQGDDVDLSQPHIMTVLGPIEPDQLGVCQPWEHVLNDAGLDEPAYLARLRAMPLAVPMARKPLPPASVQWAQASCEVAVRPGFYPARNVVGADYVDAWRPVAEVQLRQGGAHLAATLNAALGGRKG